MNPIRIYLVGAGVIARTHAAAAAKLPRPAEIYVTDPSGQAIEEFTKQFPDAKVRDSLEALLAGAARADDVVIVASPPCAHAAPSIKALDSGRNVLCEKPLALNAAEAKQMLEAARRHQKHIGCCSVRFVGLSATAEVKRLLSGKVLGKLYHVSWINRQNRSRTGIEYQPGSRWFLDPAKNGGGTVMDWGPYDVAAWSELFAPTRIDVLHAWMSQVRTGVDPKDLSPELDFQAGATLHLYASDGTMLPLTYERAAATHGEARALNEIEGTQGSVRWDWLGGGKVSHSFDRDGKLQTSQTMVPEPWSGGVLEKPLHYFYQRVTNQPSPAFVNERAVFNFLVLRAIYDAARTGRSSSVKISDL